MKCVKCKKENIISANYCRYCGNKFDIHEKRFAKRKTFIGKLEMYEKTKALVTLNAITGNVVFKIGSLLIFIMLGIYFTFMYGNGLKIMKSDNYDLQYNTKKDEYYVILKDYESYSLDFYIPNSIETLKYYKSDGYNSDEAIEIKKGESLNISHNDTYYYVIEGYKGNKKKDSIKVWVYTLGEDNE